MNREWDLIAIPAIIPGESAHVADETARNDLQFTANPQH